MTEFVQKLQLGQATVYNINVGDSQISMADIMDVDEEDYTQYPDAFSGPIRCPINCVLAQLPHTTVLIDASLHMPPDSPFAIPNETPPPGLLARLDEVGVSPESIEHVIFTHAHFDHINGAVKNGNPCFPNATYYLGQADWDDDGIQEHMKQAFGSPSPLDILRQSGKLELVTGNIDVASGVKIIATPGETKGHQMARIESEGQVLYSIGDLCHHPMEVEQPTWASSWANQQACEASRKILFDAALSEDAFIISTHIHGIGKLQQQADASIAWVSQNF